MQSTKSFIVAIVLTATAMQPSVSQAQGPPGQGNTGMAYGYFMQGIKQESQGDLQGAVDSFRRSISSAPRVKEVHHELAKCLAKSGQNEQAYGEFMTAINIDGHYVEARNNFGQFLRQTGKEKQAKMQFERCIILDPKFAPAYYNLAGLLKEKGDLNGAIDNFQHAVDLQPNFAEAQEQLGMCIFERASQGDLSTAAEKLETAARLIPKNPRIHYHLGLIYATKSKLDAAEDQFRTALMNESQLAVAHWELGKLRYYRGDLDRSVAEMKQALAVNPEYTAKQGYKEIDLIKVKTLLAKSYEHMGDPVNELGVLKQLVAMRRSDALYAKRIKDLEREIRRLGNENKRKNAGASYDPEEVDAFIAKGIDAYEDGNLDAAKAAFQRGLDLNPKSFRSLQQICFIQEAQGDLQAALVTAQKALELNPTYDGAVYNLAYLLEKAGLPDEAARMYQKYRGMADSYPYDPQHITDLQQNIIREQKKEQPIRRHGF